MPSLLLLLLIIISSVDTVQRLQQDLSFIKEELIQSSVELSAMIRAFKERLYYKTLPSNGQDGNLSAEITRRIEVWVDDAQWCLMSNDGQLQVRLCQHYYYKRYPYYYNFSGF